MPRQTHSDSDSKPAGPAPLFEIIPEREARRRRPKRRDTSFVRSPLAAIRALVETAYVSFAGGALVRFERIEDARAERAYKSRIKKAGRQRPAPRR